MSLTRLLATGLFSVPHLLKVSVGEELLVIYFLPHCAESLFAYFDSRSGIVDQSTIGVKGEEVSEGWVAVFLDDGVNNLQHMVFSSAIEWFKAELLQYWRSMGSSWQMTGYTGSHALNNIQLFEVCTRNSNEQGAAVLEMGAHQHYVGQAEQFCR